MTGCGLIVDALALLGFGLVCFVIGYLIHRWIRFVGRCNSVYKAIYPKSEWRSEIDDVKGRLDSFKWSYCTPDNVRSIVRGMVNDKSLKPKAEARHEQPPVADRGAVCGETDKGGRE